MSQTSYLKKSPIIGFVRYSQKIEFGGNVRNMFEPEYFEYRYKIFTDITLKSFQQQTNPNFILFVLHSENMPQPYKERFLKLEKENAFLHNIFMHDTKEAFDEALAGSVNFADFENNVAITFRVDNDDAVQADYIEKLNTFLKEEFAETCISIPLMYRLKRIAEKSFMVEDFYFPANAIGLAYVTTKENYRTVSELGDHDLVNNKNKMILMPKNLGGGLMTINGENAINWIDHSKAKILSTEELLKYFADKQLKNLDLDCLRIFPDETASLKFRLNKKLKLLVPPIFQVVSNKLNIK